MKKHIFLSRSFSNLGPSSQGFAKPVLVMFACLISLWGCDRPENQASRVVIRIPSDLKLMKSTDDSMRAVAMGGELECFAVSITGTGIGTNARSCGPQTGIVGGFVPSGGALSLDVPTGTGRNVSVFMYLAPAGSTKCPAWDAGFESNYGTNYKQTYKLKELTGLSFTQPEESLTIDVGAPASLDNNILAQLGQTEICQPKISGYLSSSGQIININGVELASLSHPIHSSFSLLSVGDYSLSSFLALSTSSVLFQPNGEVEVPPYLRSIIRHPINVNSVIGLRNDGGLEEVSLATGIATEMLPASCVFSSCQVPPWMSSITLSPDNKLYGLDHAGNFYQITANGPEVVAGVNLPPYAVQVVF